MPRRCVETHPSDAAKDERGMGFRFRGRIGNGGHLGTLAGERGGSERRKMLLHRVVLASTRSSQRLERIGTARLDVSSRETSVGSSCCLRVCSKRVVRKLGAFRHAVNFLDIDDLLNHLHEYLSE